MLTRTHFVFSVFLCLILFWINVVSVPNKILFLLFVIIGTIIVDIDSKKSFVGKIILFRPIQWVFSHRGMFHTILFAVLFSLVVAFFDRWLGVAFAFGYISHILLDCFTPAGVRLFWPLWDGKIGFGVRSGGLIEEILFVLLLLADLMIVFKMFIIW
ncbi:MAG: metal-dependent hydrolase [archaeon]